MCFNIAIVIASECVLKMINLLQEMASPLGIEKLLYLICFVRIRIKKKKKDISLISSIFMEISRFLSNTYIPK